jgi:hypothetical protein
VHIKKCMLKKILSNSKEKNVSRIRKKTFYLQFCMGTPEGNEFAGSTQNLKQIAGTPKLPIKTKVLPKKVCLVP